VSARCRRCPDGREGEVYAKLDSQRVGKMSRSKSVDDHPVDLFLVSVGRVGPKWAGHLDDGREPLKQVRQSGSVRRPGYR
jgi:hypothetical protein